MIDSSLNPKHVLAIWIYLNPPRVWNLGPLTTKNRPGGWNLTPLEGLGIYIYTVYMFNVHDISTISLYLLWSWFGHCGCGDWQIESPLLKRTTVLKAFPRSIYILYVNIYIYISRMVRLNIIQVFIDFEACLISLKQQHSFHLSLNTWGRKVLTQINHTSN